MSLLPIFLTFILFSISALTISRELVSLSTGHIVEGYLAKTDAGQSARVFLGVPYAEPPIEELRFQKTRPLLRVNYSKMRPISCRSYKPSCWQNRSMVGGERLNEMSEDCLYLNVYSGQECRPRNGRLCPVLYYIHGGAFEFDSPTLFPVDTLVDNFASRGLVMVTVAYRLSVLGFWSTGTDKAAGNYALYDVLEGLKWVKREIEAFGGDPAKVTIMGQSSGASFVSLLTLTPKSKDLFRQAIFMSRGPLLTDQLFQYQEIAIELGCSQKTDWTSPWFDTHEQRIIDCMRKVDPALLIDSYWNYESQYDHLITAPRLDGPGGLFPESLSSLVRRRRPIDAVIGTTINEFGPNKLNRVNATAEDLSLMCEAEIDKAVVNRKTLLTAECRRRYAFDQSDSDNSEGNSSTFAPWAEQMARLEGDVLYHGPAYDEAATLVDAGSKVFLYSFDYVKKGLEGIAPWHAFDLTFVLGIHPFPFDDRDREIKSTYVSLFANFTKFGHPTPSSNLWRPLSNPPLDMVYLSVDLPTSMQLRYHYDAVLFWNYIVPTIGERKESGNGRIRFLPANPSLENEDKNRLSENQISDGNEIDARAPRARTTKVQSMSGVLIFLATLAFIVFSVTISIRRSRRYRQERKIEEKQAFFKSVEGSYSTF